MNPLSEKWPREKALKIRTIISRMKLCGCGTDAHWQCVFELLCEAESHTKEGFYRDKWFEFGAKCIDSWDLIDHGTGIGRAWLTEDGKLLLQFLRDFGLEDWRTDDDSGHPLWSVEFSWEADAKDGDTYSEWVARDPKAKAKASTTKQT